jgi:DNA-binding transcriptional regulator YdaS (Cro superfamily)
VARAMGINETLMQQYVNGVKKPTYERRMQIERYIRELGLRLTQISLE